MYLFLKSYNSLSKIISIIPHISLFKIPTVNSLPSIYSSRIVFLIFFSNSMSCDWFSIFSNPLLDPPQIGFAIIGNDFIVLLNSIDFGHLTFKDSKTSLKKLYSLQQKLRLQNVYRNSKII